jgi:hypothetical protein
LASNASANLPGKVARLGDSQDVEILAVINMKKKEVTVEVDLPPQNAQYQELLVRGVEAITDTGNKKALILQDCGANWNCPRDSPD